MLSARVHDSYDREFTLMNRNAAGIFNKSHNDGNPVLQVTAVLLHRNTGVARPCPSLRDLDCVNAEEVHGQGTGGFPELSRKSGTSAF